ncbi:hypothetical protein CH54_2914 [Yersinia rochesterensis]|uniref:Uncharacterized protein n=1 Tax=Yersinia rochesterensis TaxID=1604335 RepID=A0ABM5ST94_9GAMM|nr:hypothetical protein DJ57_3731 [Yersinia rochesterensis]AJI88050.1 hypothetical protein AW19_2874 [Yersinia frederiksenii Y225]AJJ37798.1 hypothetical protein CH54_2914 [Yersinia rochesterensis]CNH92168.1 Uncharacterised protein [Yersinia kristensenii]CRY66429.1 Uncharacterised protein [Yersinia kristensenii]
MIESLKIMIKSLKMGCHFEKTGSRSKVVSRDITYRKKRDLNHRVTGYNQGIRFINP